jgi:hypothetical protein
MVNRAIAATIGILIAVNFVGPNKACARSAGAGGAIAHGAVGLGGSQSIHRGIGPGLGGSRFSANPAQNFAPRRDRRFGRSGFPGWPLEDCGGCYGAPGDVEPYDYGAEPYQFDVPPYDNVAGPYNNDVTFSEPPLFLLRPPRRFQPETYVVPSEISSVGLGNTSDRAVTFDDWAVLGPEPKQSARWHLHRPRPGAY